MRLRERLPHLAILVDFPDFNLRLAKKLGAIGIPIIYLISPQIWAWRGNRVKWIKKIVNRMLVILPFEKGFYSEKGVDVEYIGHPLIDRVSTTTSKRLFFERYSLDERIPTVSLLPGSRKKEICLQFADPPANSQASSLEPSDSVYSTSRIGCPFLNCT